MPDSICLADCLYQDEQGRIAIRTDNNTIKCEQDASGVSYLVAKSGLADCATWPFACASNMYGQPVYCDTDGKLYAGLKPYYKSGEQGSYSLIPNLGTLVALNNQVLRSTTMDYVNDDPCRRSVELNIDFLFNGYDFTVPARTGLRLLPEYTTNGIDWIRIQGTGIFNHSYTDSTNIVESATTWKKRVVVAPGQAVTMGMRWRTGTTAEGHSSGFSFNVTSESLYGFQLYWDARGI